MANVLGELFGDIATAIRSKTGEEGTMKPAEFPEKIGGIIEDISLPGEMVVFKRKKVTGFALDSTFGAFSPGYVSPPEFTLDVGKRYRVIWDGAEWNCEAFAFELSGMSIVAIGNASSLGMSGNNEPFLIAYNVTANNTQLFSTEQKAEHTVGIYTEATSEILLQEKTVTENGVVEPDEGFDGLSKVIVDVLSSGGAGNFKYVTNSFKPTSAVATVSHGMGCIPDIIIVANANIPTAGTQYISYGFSKAMMDKIENAASLYPSKVYFLNGSMPITLQIALGFDVNGSDTNSVNYGHIRGVTTSTFTVGGSTYAKLATSNDTYRYTCISGITG